MEPERDEVYERIPWETLEPKGANRQWLVYAVAAALVLGALAYSFTRNQQVPPAQPASAPAVTSTVRATTASSVAASPPSTAASPIVVAEADLYAVDPERLFESVAAHAEWFATEYVSHDGSAVSASILEDLLPEGTPLPEAPEGTQVFVDWARATNVSQTGITDFEVEITVRSLVATEGSAFARLPPLRLAVAVGLDEDGSPRVIRPPLLMAVNPAQRAPLTLQSVPTDVAASLEVEGEVVGGLQEADGTWQVVVMSVGADGVTRPVTVLAAASP